MDPRLRKVLADRIEADRILNAKLLRETKAKLAAEAELLVQQAIQAGEWVENNIFTAIAFELNRARESVVFSDYSYDTEEPARIDIPAYLLAKSAEKIDGLHVITKKYDAFDDNSGLSYPSHVDYHVRWFPENSLVKRGYWTRFSEESKPEDQIKQIEAVIAEADKG